MTSGVINNGPFLWVKRLPAETVSGSTDEVWRLKHPTDMKDIIGLTAFCLKNYGGEPGPGFKGWKLVSGGPFDDAGAYSNLQDAIAGVTPYLIQYFTEQAAARMVQANRIIQMVSNFQDSL